MIQIGSDGGLLPAPVRRKEIPLEPAERVDVIVDFRQFGVGSKVILHNQGGEPSTSAVMRFDVVRGSAEEARIPKLMREEEELPEVNAERSWPLTFQGLAGGASMWQIGGGGFDEMRIDCRPRQGSTELWTWRNLSNRTHPMHMHGYHFKIVSMNGKPPHPGDRGWKDTVAVYPNETVVVRPYFDYFAGLYVFHCHAAEHGDMSMMGQDGGRGMRLRLLIATLVAFALAPSAAEAAVTRFVQAYDSPSFRTVWWPTTLSAQVGDTVTWRLTQPGNANAAVHDIWLVPPGALCRNPARRLLRGPDRQRRGGHHGHLPVLLLHPRRPHAGRHERRGQRRHRRSRPARGPRQALGDRRGAARPERAGQRHDGADGVRGGRQHPAHARRCSRRRRPRRARAPGSRSRSRWWSRCASRRARRSSPPSA